MSPLAFVFAFVLVVSRPATAWNHPVSCMEVSQDFCECLAYIDGLSSDPTNLCCQKIDSLNAIAKRTNGGAGMICKCIQEYGSVYGNLPFNASNIQQLPIKCKTKLSFPISQHMDCSRVK